MSRIGNRPVAIPAGVEVKLDGSRVFAKGEKGELTFDLPSVVSAEIKDGQVVVTRNDETKFARSMHGTARSMISNMVDGVSKGYSRELEIEGVGYKAQQQGAKVILSLGFSHTIEYEAPEGVTLTVTDASKVTVSGADKQKVGLASARIRGFSPAEPYKGKGVRYKNERVRRKAGKTVA